MHAARSRNAVTTHAQPSRRRSGGPGAVALLVLAGLLAALAVGPPSGLGATPSTRYDVSRVESPTPQDRGRWAERVATISDLTGDGVNELLVAVPMEDVDGKNDAGRVYMLSGATRSVLYAIASPESQQSAKFGFFISALGDVSGDGKDDFAVGTDSQDVGSNTDQGKAWVFSGVDGALIRALDNPNPQSSARFGSRIGRAGDVTGDGRPEAIVGASNNDVPAGCGSQSPMPVGCRVNEGEAFVFDVAAGTLVRTLSLPALDRVPPSGITCPSSCGSFGLSVQGPGDADGDGVTDQLVAASSYATNGRMYLFSGASGAVLSRIDPPEPQPGSNFAFQDAAPLSPGDVTGDGRAELYANGFTQNGPSGLAEGRAWVFDGAQSVATGSGSLLYTLRDPSPAQGGQFGWSLARTEYNGDGVFDLYVGSSPHHTPDASQNGGTYVFDGRDGSLLKALEMPPPDSQPGVAGNTGPNLGWGLAAPGDLNRDGAPDYIGGAPFFDVGSNADQGRIYAFLSNVPPAAPAPPAAGRIAPFAGCLAASANLILGTAGADRRNGTPAGDRIFAGAGSDVIDGLAGHDCIDLGPGTDRGAGGAGDDLVLGGLGDDRVSGGSGNDRLRGNPGDDRISAGRGDDRAYGDSGNDRIDGSFGNDRLHGVGGHDRIRGSRGRDRINGGRLNDVISGGSSGDLIRGDHGRDRINGNSGNDRINGNSANDRIRGGSGRDRIAGGSGNDRIRGDSGHDRLRGSRGRDRISGGSGNDRINARDGRGGDRVNCGRGRDRVVADPGDIVAANCERVSRRRR